MVISDNKVLVIGLDGATFDLIMPWIKEGKLPTISNMITNGVYGELTSTIPMFTPTAWSSFITGKNPGKHGVMGFFSRNKYNYTLSLNTFQRRGKTIWDILGEAGKRVIIINVPTTYPPNHVNGLIISGMLTPPNSKNFTYPLSLQKEIDDIVGGYKIYPSVNYDDKNEDIFISDIYDVTIKQGKIAEYLIQKYPWDFFMVVLNGTDLLQHGLWKYIDSKHPDFYKEKEKKYNDIFLEYYKLIDNIICRLSNKVGNNTLKIIVSDHGFGPLYKFIHINQWLLRLKFMNVKTKPLSLLRFFLFRLGITPNNVYNLLIKIKLYTLRTRLGRNKGHKFMSKFFFSFSDIDWNRTIAYSLGSMGQIHLNIKNREPHGIITRKTEYNYYKNKIIDNLNILRDPDSKNLVIDKIYLKEEIYDGKYYDELPDIIFLPKKGYIGFEEFEFASNNVFTKAQGISGTHRLNGILIIECKTFIKKGIKLDYSPNIYDVFPTIIKFMNIPFDSDVDGIPILKAFN